MQEVINKDIEDMLAMGVIEHSEAPYASPLVLVELDHIVACRIVLAVMLLTHSSFWTLTGWNALMLFKF